MEKNENPVPFEKLDWNEQIKILKIKVENKSNLSKEELNEVFNNLIRLAGEFIEMHEEDISDPQEEAEEVRTMLRELESVLPEKKNEIDRGLGHIYFEILG